MDDDYEEGEGDAQWPVESPLEDEDEDEEGFEEAKDLFDSEEDEERTQMDFTNDQESLAIAFDGNITAGGLGEDDLQLQMQMQMQQQEPQEKKEEQGNVKSPMKKAQHRKGQPRKSKTMGITTSRCISCQSKAIACGNFDASGSCERCVEYNNPCIPIRLFNKHLYKMDDEELAKKLGREGILQRFVRPLNNEQKNKIGNIPEHLMVESRLLDGICRAASYEMFIHESFYGEDFFDTMDGSSLFAFGVLAEECIRESIASCLGLDYETGRVIDNEKDEKSLVLKSANTINSIKQTIRQSGPPRLGTIKWLEEVERNTAAPRKVAKTKSTSAKKQQPQPQPKEEM